MRGPHFFACLLILGACGSSGGTPQAQDASTQDPSDGNGDENDNGQDGSVPSGGDGDGSGDGDGDGDGSGDGDAPGDGDGGDGDMPVNARSFVYVGGWDWTNSESYPFRTYQLNRETGALTPVGDTVNLGPNPSFIMPSPDGRFLYVSNEHDGENGGVTVGKIDSATGEVSKLDHESTGSDFVYTSIDPGGKFVLAASYGNGNVSVFPRNSDGSIEAAVSTLAFADGSNAHSIRVDLSGKWAYVPNLGKNEIEQLTFDSSTGKLGKNPAAAALGTGDGTGPRHIAIHPDGKHVYVMFEKTPQLGAYQIQANGTLEQIDLERTVPQDAQEGAGSHVLIHPNGKFVYVGNRHQNSIAVFAIAQDGTLTFVDSESVRGDFPRNFDIDPSGSVLVVANQGENRGEAPNTGSLAVFSIGADGKLAPLGDTVTGLPFPTGVAIVNLP